MASSSTQEHRRSAEKLAAIRVAVLTISDTRTPETDKSGALIQELLRDEGHEVVYYEVLRDEPLDIKERVFSLCQRPDVQAVLLNGGTGISPRDGTFEALESILLKSLRGFGELFRMLSWAEVGSAAMLSRATAGICGTAIVFSMPGSTNAVGLAMRSLILPELRHLVFELTK